MRARGWDVNRKRVQRLMREDNLLCVVKHRFVVPTTDSAHAWKVYPNRIRQHEEVHRTEYRNLPHARSAIGQFLEKIYNQSEPGVICTLRCSGARRVAKRRV